MNQASLELGCDTPMAPPRDGFDIGWDHARHGLVPPAEWLDAQSGVCQGWLAGKAALGRGTLPTRRPTRQWLALRLAALREGLPFDADQLTPHVLSQLEATRCPVRRLPLGGAAGQADAAAWVRLSLDAGYRGGNLVMLSAAASEALGALGVRDLLRRAAAAHAMGQAIDGHDAATWTRLAVLRSFGTPMPFAQAARLPMAVLPPNRVRLVNPVQGLQALLTRLFLVPGWSTRCREVAAMLPEHTLRLDFNLFVGAMAPRVLEAPGSATERREAMEDAWLHERVQRRWQHLALALGEAGCEALLQRLAALPWPGFTVLSHDDRLLADEAVTTPSRDTVAAPRGLSRQKPLRQVAARPDRRGTAAPRSAPAPRA